MKAKYLPIVLYLTMMFVRDCQSFMGFIPVQYVIDIRTTNVLVKCIDPENTFYKTLAKKERAWTK